MSSIHISVYLHSAKKWWKPSRPIVGIGPILLDEISCPAESKNLTDCTHSQWGMHDCTHDEDVAIACLPQGQSVWYSHFLNAAGVHIITAIHLTVDCCYNLL